MADWYFHHAAAGANNGTNWANAYTNLSSMSGKAAADRFFVAHDHAQTQGSALTITSPGTEANPCQIYCVSRSGSVPPVAADLRTTATVTTTGAFAITMAGSVSECYGITFSSGTGSTVANLLCSNTASRSWRYVSCALRTAVTTNTCRVTLGSAGGHCILENTTVQLAHVSGAVNLIGRVTWKQTASAVTGATLPTTLFICTSPCVFLLEGVDISPVGSSKNLMNPAAQPQDFVFKDCKIGASNGVYSVAPTSGSVDLLLMRTDSADTNYRTERHNYMGAQTTETTIIHTGGATDGVTPIAWKIVTSANTEREYPFECTPISIWNAVTGTPFTITIDGIWGGGSTPLDTDIWFEVFGLGISTGVISSFGSSGTPQAIGMIVGTNLDAGTGSWGGSTTKFKMWVDVTTDTVGPITIYVKAALPSSTFYLDPKPVIT